MLSYTLGVNPLKTQTPPNERLSDPRGLKWVCTETEDNIIWESVENGTKRLGTKETCQMCEPRQTGYRLIPSRPCKWGKKKKQKQKGIAGTVAASDARFQISLYIFFQAYIASLSLQSSISSDQSNRLWRSHAFVLDFIKRRSPGSSHHWFLLITLIGALTSLRAAWP